MKRTPFAAILVMLLVPALPADAYDSQCVPGSAARTQAAAYERICAPTCEEVECADGVAKARGTQLGEHTWITHEAMRWAGLATYAEDEELFDYHGLGGDVTPDYDSLEPAGGGAMVASVARPYTIPELSQLPDMSYSMIDFLLGNEHCPVIGMPRGSLAEVEQCHQYKHMGSMNSTHFLPQAHKMYEHYRALAVETAERCALMHSAFGASEADPLHPMQALVQSEYAVACEREALAWQAIASHYLEDAWSSGHMWQRWGSPLYGQSEEGWPGDLAVALVSGLFHGYRSVAESVGVGDVDVGDLGIGLEHDQLCMPGPYGTSFVPGVEPSASIVEWLGADGAWHAGGGDEYLFACQNSRTGWSVAEHVALRPQYQRMLTCLARGFGEVYDAGPKTAGDRAPSGSFDPTVGSSLDTSCWAQRATNASMWQAAGISGWPESRNAKIVSKLLVKLTASQSGVEIDQERFRIELTYVHLAAEALALKDPRGTQFANAPPPLLGLQPNGAYEGLIPDGVEYLEPPRAAWGPADAPQQRCTSDAECSYSRYCGAAGADGARACQNAGAAILYAFREAETPAWCEAETVDSISDAARTCAEWGGDACDACERLVLPHVANACDAGSYEPAVRALELDDDEPDVMIDHRAVCHVLADGGSLVSTEPATVYRPYDPAVDQDFRRAAQRFCLEGRPVSAEAFTYDFDVDWPAPAEDVFDLGSSAPPFRRARNTCGAGIATHRWRLGHRAEFTDPHTHTLAVRPLPLVEADGTEHIAETTDLEVNAYLGPACAGADLIASGEPVGDHLELTLDFPPGADVEVCVRVKAKRYDLWSSYELEETRPSCGRHIATGDATTCMVRQRDATVWCWGLNNWAQVGVGTYAEDTLPDGDAPWFIVNTPMQVLDPSDPSGVLTDVDCLAETDRDPNHMCAIKKDKSVWCWGYNSSGQVGNGAPTTDCYPPGDTCAAFPTAVVGLGEADQVVLGGWHSCARKPDGTVWCWGISWNGALGIGPGATDAWTPVQVLNVTGAMDISAVGWFSASAETPDGLWAWGGTADLVSGLPVTFAPSWSPILYSDFLCPDGGCVVEGNLVQGLSFGPSGGLVTWGYEFDPDWYDGVPPVWHLPGSLPPLDHDVIDADLLRGSDRLCYVRRDRTAHCLGYAPLGDGTADNSFDTPVQVAVDDVVEISMGGEATCALTASNEVYCWGSNEFGSIGNGMDRSDYPPGGGWVVTPTLALVPP